MASYIIVSTRIRLETGPTVVGDEQSDPEIMHRIGARLVKEVGNNYSHWQCPEAARPVLERLDTFGYRVIAMCGVGQTCMWTLRKEGQNPAGVASVLAGELHSGSTERAAVSQ